MQPTVKRRAKTSLVWLLALSLLISISASTIALANRIQYYTAVVDVESMIPLVPEHITLEDLRTAATVKKLSARRFSAVNMTYCAPVELAADTYFSVSDDNTIWGTNTKVDIFRTSYENGQHNITVASGNGDKIIAPGTENSYTFKLKNSISVPMDYTVTVNAWFTPDDVSIPVTCRLSRYDGHWVAGGDAAWLYVPAFDGAEDTAVLSPESYVTYTLDWQWPFEGNDALDTALGQRANEEDLSLTIEIVTTATAVFDDEPDDPDDPDDPPEPPVDPDDPDDPPKPPVDPDDPDNPPVDPDDPPKPPVNPENPDDPFEDPEDPEKPGIGQELPPKTGDDSNPVLWMAVAAVSFVLLMLMIFWKDKDENNTPSEGKKREKT